MVKSGLILGVVALIFTTLATLISPICTPCLAVLIGLFAGYLGGILEKPYSEGNSAKIGATAGVISGVGAIIGQIIGALINANIVGPEGVMNMLGQLNIPASSDVMNYYTPIVYGSAFCIGVFNLIMMAGLGALGGLLWFQINGRKNRNTI